MRIVGALVLTLAIAVPFAASRSDLSAQAGTGGAAGAPEIKEVAEKYRKASLAGDVKALAALYAEDAVEMPPNHPVLKGRANIEAYYRKMMDGAKLTALNFTHLDTRASGDIGYDVGAYTQTLVPAGGSEMKDSGHYTVILRRTDGAWRVAYAIYNSDRPEPPAAQKPKS